MKRHAYLSGASGLAEVTVSYPDTWDDTRVSEVLHDIAGVERVVLGKPTEEFPDLEYTENGLCLSWAHLLGG